MSHISVVVRIPYAIYLKIDGYYNGKIDLMLKNKKHRYIGLRLTLKKYPNLKAIITYIERLYT